MSYDEEHARKSRVVVETPNARREVVHSQEVRTPDRNGVSAGMVGVLVVVAIALITILVLFWMSQPVNDPNANLAAQQTQPPPTIVQQPAQPPVIIQQPAPVTTQPAPVIITPGAPAGGSTGSAPANDDSTVQLAIDKTIADDPNLSTLGITATVLDGKVTLLGVVRSEAIKGDVEKTIRRIRGVKEIDNKITVIA